MRRSKPGKPPLSAAWNLTCGHLSFDRRARRATLQGAGINLTPKAQILLDYLMTCPDEMVTREHLLDGVWGWDYPVGSRAVDTRVAELRRALDGDTALPRFIETILG